MTSWDDISQAWIVLASETALDVLRSPDVLDYEHKRELQDFAGPRGIRIDALMRALSKVPLTNNGDVHKAARKEFAAAMQPGSKPPSQPSGKPRQSASAPSAPRTAR